MQFVSCSMQLIDLYVSVKMIDKDCSFPIGHFSSFFFAVFELPIVEITDRANVKSHKHIVFGYLIELWSARIIFDLICSKILVDDFTFLFTMVVASACLSYNPPVVFSFFVLPFYSDYTA